MPQLTLELPVAGEKILSGLHATNYADIQALLNGGLAGDNFSQAAALALGSLGITFGGDTNLYRSSANILKTDDAFHAAGLKALTGAVEISLGNLYLYQDTAQILLGAAGDTNLYRSAANTLKTDDSLAVGANIILDPAGGITLVERTDPGAGANTGVVYTRDNGAGKTQLVVRFGSGAVQVLATEP